MAEETTKSAEKVYSVEDIQFNEANKAMAVLACIPIIGLILLFTEKKDLFVRYMGAQSTIAGAILLVCGIVPVVGWLLAPILGLLLTILEIVAIIKTLQGQRFDFPVISGWALKLMAKI